MADRDAGFIWSAFWRDLSKRLPRARFFRMFRWARNRDQVHCHALVASPETAVDHETVRTLWRRACGGADVCVRPIYSKGAVTYATLGHGEGARYEQAPAHDPVKFFHQVNASRGILKGVSRTYTPCLEDRSPCPPRKDGWTFCHYAAERALLPVEFPFGDNAEKEVSL